MSQVTINGEIHNQYLSKQGTPTFVYPVTGTPENLEAFKTAQGTYYRENEGVPLYFSTRPLDANTVLTQGSTGRFSVQTDLIAAVAKSENLRDGYKAKFQATQEFLGLTKKEMQELMLAQLMA